MGLYRRGKVWNGRTSWNGKQVRFSTGTSDKKLAERIYHKVLGEIAERRWFKKLPGEDKTFEEMMKKYLAEHVSKMKSERSFKGYATNLNSFFADYMLSEITPRLINEYKAKRRADGLKPASINRELATLKKAFNLALKEWEWVKENPVARVSMEKENNKRGRWLTFEEEKKLLRRMSLWLRHFTVLALHTGMRLGELLSLTWEGIDLNRKTITVFESKNGEKRTIPMNETIFNIVKRIGKVRSIKTFHLFYTSSHTPMDARNVRRSFQLALKRAGIENFRFHDLRHTFATRLVQGGVDLYKVQTLLGHKTPAMTQRYAHHYPESLRDGVEILDRVRKSSTNLAHSAYRKVSRNG